MDEDKEQQGGRDGALNRRPLVSRLIRRLQDPENPNSLAQRLRRRRAAHIAELIELVHGEKGRCEIIDLGGEAAYWRVLDRAFLKHHQVRITIVNPRPMDVIDPLFDVLQADACDLGEIADRSFDLVHSNSVIEHVGDWTRMEAFAREARRLAPRYYVQTPNFSFPIEPHFSEPFFHWRSEQWRAYRLLRRQPAYRGDLGHAMRDVQSARLLDHRQFQYLFPDAHLIREVFFGLTKSLIAIRK
jgi:hypothetical protein